MKIRVPLGTEPGPGKAGWRKDMETWRNLLLPFWLEGRIPRSEFFFSEEAR